MALESYHRKRDFSKTAEPKGSKARSRGREGGNSFVIQKHDARRLHYDFRLELDGVLKSWAVAKGPSLIAGEKRLAVHTEDHPLEYGDFEGTIPKGEYGGGTVIVWDRGTWEPVFDPHRGLAKGHLEFELHGDKLKGRWHLVRMAGRPREKTENWLLIKAEDEFALAEGSPDILLEERPESVKTGRVVEEVADEEPGWSSKTGRIEPKRAKRRQSQARQVKDPGPPPPEPAKVKGARPAPIPAFIEPTLASLAVKPPSGKRWIHEIKFDGYRLQARIEAGRVKLFTRTGLDWTAKFGKEIVAAFKALPVGTAVIDGELVVETAAGVSDFSALQADLSDGRSDRFVYYAFDLLYLDGFDIRDVPLTERKALLHQVIPGETGRLRFSSHFDGDGSLILRHAGMLGLEGIISKLADEPYRSARGKGWLKAKFFKSQEVVIGGWVQSSTSRKAIGSLVCGVYDGGRLDYIGRVGTGFSGRVAEDLYRRLERIKTDRSPFARRLTSDEARGVRFVRPELVAAVDFRVWTADGIMRHAAFQGLREDKRPEEVKLETPRTAPAAPRAQEARIALTHPDRLYWPDEGVTKQGLADYYTEVWPHIGPFLINRPLALLRCPGGIFGEHFFQKHAWKGMNENIVLVRDPTDEEPLVSIRDLDGLLGLVQAAVLEIHPWGSTVRNLERPDMIIMDLDPGPGVAWSQVIEAAHETRDRLKAAGLAAFVKTSGGKGLHVVAPLKPSTEWPEIKAFTKAIADRMAADSPDRFVSTIAKAKRQRKILIDYLRNQRGATAVAAYSTRARPGAAVSMPLSWEELSPAIGPAYYTVDNALKRLAALGTDPWADFRAAAAPLEKPKARRRTAA